MHGHTQPCMDTHNHWESGTCWTGNSFILHRGLVLTHGKYIAYWCNCPEDSVTNVAVGWQQAGNTTVVVWCIDG